MIFRQFKPEDLDSIVLLEKRAFPVGPYTRSMLKKVFSARDSFNFVAEESGIIMGYTVALPLDEKSADVESIAVDPDLHRGGLGTLLLGKIENAMRERSFQYSVLEVRDKNDEAINFYKKHGYVAITHMPTYYTEIFRGSRGAYRMVKKL